MRVELSDNDVCDIRSFIVFRLNHCKRNLEVAGARGYWKSEVHYAQRVLAEFDAKTKGIKPIEPFNPPEPVGYADEFGGWKAHEEERIQ